MKWIEMKPEDKNRLVAIHIMGWQAKECDGEIGEQPCSSDGWFCQKCGVEGGWGDEYTHEEQPRRYTQSMERAWEVVKKMKTYHRPLLVDARKQDLTIADIFLVRLWEAVDKRGMDALFEYTPEIICKAALQACGVDI